MKENFEGDQVCRVRYSVPRYFLEFAVCTAPLYIGRFCIKWGEIILGSPPDSLSLFLLYRLLSNPSQRPMIGYGCNVSQYPQFFVEDLDMYQVLPRPYLRSFDGFLGDNLM